MSVYEWKPHWSYETIDPKRCRASVTGGSAWRSSQCARAAKIDGKWCKQHSPAEQERKKRERNAKYEAETERMEARWAEEKRRAACARALAGIEDPEGAVRELVEASLPIKHKLCDTTMPTHLVIRFEHALAPFLAARNHQ